MKKKFFNKINIRYLRDISQIRTKLAEKMFGKNVDFNIES